MRNKNTYCCLSLLLMCMLVYSKLEQYFHSKVSGILFIHQPLGFLGPVSPWGWNPMLVIRSAATWQGLAWAFLQKTTLLPQ